MKTFELHRTTDVSGVSGTGVIAQGCQFDDGLVVLRWLGVHASLAVWDDVNEMLAVHGHDGATTVHWLYTQSNAAARTAYNEVPLDRSTRSEPLRPGQESER